MVLVFGGLWKVCVGVCGGCNLVLLQPALGLSPGALEVPTGGDQVLLDPLQPLHQRRLLPLLLEQSLEDHNQSHHQYGPVVRCRTGVEHVFEDRQEHLSVERETD